jgi:uncharacterized membrane protein
MAFAGGGGLDIVPRSGRAAGQLEESMASETQASPEGPVDKTAETARSQDIWSAIERHFEQIWRFGPLYLLIAASPGLALWPLVRGGLAPSMLKNDLTQSERSGLAAALAGSVLAVTLLVGLRFWSRRHEPTRTFAATVQAFNRYGFILLALPILWGLGTGAVETEAPVFTAFLLSALAAMAAVWVYRVLGLPSFAPRDEPFQAALSPRLAFSILVAFVLAYWGLFSYYAIIDHHNLATKISDLGIYDNVVFNTLHGKFLATNFSKGGDHTSSHFDPLLALVALPYALSPRAETLLVLQTLWIASGAFVVWASVRARLANEWLALIFALLFLLYPALHGVNMYEFHSLALMIPLALAAVHLLDTKRYRAYWPVLAALLLTREDLSLFSCFIGAYAILTRRVRTGVATIAVALVYLFVVKRFFMRDSGLLMAASASATSDSYAYYFKEMIPFPGEGVRGFLLTLVTSPLYALQVLFKLERVLFFWHLLFPLLFLPLFSGKKRVLMVYGLMFLGLATRKWVFSLYFQYSSLFFPMLFAALPDGFARVVDSPALPAFGISRARLAWALAAGVLVATLGTSWKYGGILPNDAFRAGFTPLVRFPEQSTRERYLKMRELASQIGPDESVMVSQYLGPHMSNRAQVYRLYEGTDADYLFVDGRLTGDERKVFNHVKPQYRLLQEGLGLQLWQRKAAEKP